MCPVDRLLEEAQMEHIRKETEKRLADRLQRYKKVEALAYKWFDGSIDGERGMEVIFGLINGEARK